MFKGTSLFAQIVSVVDRAGFQRIVSKHRADKHSKGFSCWDQCVSMLYCHLAQATSLREICGGLATVTGKIVHLGLHRAPKRSTLSYANEHRSFEIYVDLFHLLHGLCAAAWRGKRKFRFKNKLFSMDATTIDLCLSLFPWAKFRQTKGAVKVHLLLDHDGYLPVFAHITEGKRHEVRVARHWAETSIFPEGSIVVCDRGYNDFELFRRWHDQGVWFVTRMKDNTRYDVIKRNPVRKGGSIRSDEWVVLTGQKAIGMPLPDFRRIVVWDEDNQREIVLLTNHLDFAASTVAKIYKDRWQIEIFFKTIKQHLKIKTFVGTSANALKVQIWTALCAILLLKYLKFLSTFGWSLSNLIAFLRVNLFTYRDLQAWLNNPFETPPCPPQTMQLALDM
jgi:hypothetical protein